MKELNFNIFNILILAGIIQGSVFGFFLLLSKKYPKGVRYLAITVFCLTLNNLQYWISDVGLNVLGELHIPFELFMIPAFFMFVNNYLENKINKHVRILIGVPFILSTFIHFLISIDSLFFSKKFIPSKAQYYFFVFEEYFSFIFSFLLIVLILKRVNKYEKANVNFSKENVTAKTKWLKQILIIGMVMCLFWIVIIYFMSTNTDIGFELYYPLWISISFLIYWISYAAASNYYLLLERKNIRKEILLEDMENTNNVKQKKELTDPKNVFLRFEVIMQESYPNPSLTIEDIACRLTISNNYLSQIINQRNIKFNYYLNNLRIQSAKKMLCDKEFSKYTITAIGLEAGFNSKASFYRAFKTHTNQTPIEYRNSVS